MSLAKKIHEKTRVYVQKLEQYADRIWYPPLIGLLSALDNIIIIIPNDGILIASSMLIPKRWFIFAINIAIGSTLGAMALSALVKMQGLPWVLEFLPGIDQSSMWSLTENFFNQYGLLVVFVVAITPIMQQPVIILATLADIPLSKIALAIFGGRFIKFMVMSYLASHSPKYLKKIWGIKEELDDAGIKIE